MRSSFSLRTVLHALVRSLSSTREGFTLFEITVVVAVIGLSAMVSVPAYQSYMTHSYVDRVAEELQQGLRNIKTAAQEGVYEHGLDIQSGTHFVGHDYAARDTSQDLVLVSIPSSVLVTGPTQIVFSCVDGLPSYTGYVYVQSLSDTGYEKTLTIDDNGFTTVADGHITVPLTTSVPVRALKGVIGSTCATVPDTIDGGSSSNSGGSSVSSVASSVSSSSSSSFSSSLSSSVSSTISTCDPTALLATAPSNRIVTVAGDSPGETPWASMFKFSFSNGRMFAIDNTSTNAYNDPYSVYECVGSDWQNRPYARMENLGLTIGNVDLVKLKHDLFGVVHYNGQDCTAAMNTVMCDGAQLGPDLPTYGASAIEVYNGELYVGTNRSNGSAATGNVYKFSAGGWLDVGRPVTLGDSIDAGEFGQGVYTLFAYNNVLYAGGTHIDFGDPVAGNGFPSVNGNANGFFARYDGNTAWTKLNDTPLDSLVLTAESYQGQLYVGTAMLGRSFICTGGGGSNSSQSIISSFSSAPSSSASSFASSAASSVSQVSSISSMSSAVSAVSTSHTNSVIDPMQGYVPSGACEGWSTECIMERVVASASSLGDSLRLLVPYSRSSQFLSLFTDTYRYLRFGPSLAQGIECPLCPPLPNPIPPGCVQTLLDEVCACPQLYCSSSSSSSVANSAQSFSSVVSSNFSASSAGSAVSSTVSSTISSAVSSIVSSIVSSSCATPPCECTSGGRNETVVGGNVYNFLGNSHWQRAISRSLFQQSGYPPVAFTLGVTGLGTDETGASDSPFPTCADPVLPTNQTSISVSTSDRWVTNGSVLSMIRQGNTLYIGGQFSRIGPNTGRGVPLDGLTGDPQSAYPRINGTVYAVTDDGAGGWYVGGEFTKVGGTDRANIVHITSRGLLDTSWNASTDHAVRVIVRNGSSLTIGGDFTMVNGTARNYAAMLDATGRDVGIDFGLNNSVRAIALRGDKVVMGGYFTSTATILTNYLALFNLDGSYSGGTTMPSVVYALATNGSDFYAGGDFGIYKNTSIFASASVVGSVRALAMQGGDLMIGAANDVSGPPNLQKINENGSVVLSWRPNVNDAVRSLALHDTSLYIGGDFTLVNGAERSYLAAVKVSDGTNLAWNPVASNAAFALATDGTHVFAGGSFVSIGGTQYARQNVAAIDLLSDNIVADWAPRISLSTAVGQSVVNTLVSDGSNVYIGGHFDLVDGQSRANLVRITALGTVDPNWSANANMQVNALALGNHSIYVGGEFTQIGGVNRNYVAKVGTDDTGTVDPVWNPSPDTMVSSLLVDKCTLFVGGLFTTIQGKNRGYIAAVGLDDGQVSDWDAQIDGWVKTMATNTRNLFVGGQFAAAGGARRSNLAAFTLFDGKIGKWTLDPSSVVLSIAATDAQVYVGGGFTLIGGVSRSYTAAVSASIPPTILPWNPAPDGVVTSLLPVDSATVFVGGSFAGLNSAQNPKPFLAHVSPYIQPVSSSSTSTSAAADTCNANGQNNSPILSGNGQYAVFESYASNLVSDDVNGLSDIFAYHRISDQIVRINLADDASEANGPSHGWRGDYRPQVSADGRFVAFISQATNLVSNDQNGTADVIIHDRDVAQTGTFDTPGNTRNTLISKSTNGAQANGSSDEVAMTSSGRFIAFVSDATNLVAGTVGQQNLFIHDRDKNVDGVFDQPGQISTVSVTVPLLSGDPNAPRARISHPSISDNGRFVTFLATYIGSTGAGTYRVYLYDRDVTNAGILDTPNNTRITQVSEQFSSTRPIVSGDGAWLAYAYSALVNGSAASFLPSEVRLYDIATQQESTVLTGYSLADMSRDDSALLVADASEHVSVFSRVGGQLSAPFGIATIDAGSLNADGTIVAILSNSSLAVSSSASAIPADGTWNIFVHDTETKQVTRACSPLGQPCHACFVQASSSASSAPENCVNAASLISSRGYLVVDDDSGIGYASHLTSESINQPWNKGINDNLYLGGYGPRHSYIPAKLFINMTPYAEWCIKNLPVGNYDVRTTWPVKPFAATNAPFTVYNGPSAYPEVTVDQAQTMGRENVSWSFLPDATQLQGAKASPFLSLGQYLVNGGKVRVRVTNDAPFTSQAAPRVESDAIWIVSTTPTFTMSDVTVSSTTPYSGVISWTTSVPTDELIEYAPPSVVNGYPLTLPVDGKPKLPRTKTHAVTLSGLRSNSLYRLRITSSDGYSFGTSELQFSTDALISMTTPVVTQVTQTGALVSWTTSAPATESLRYGTTTLYEIGTIPPIGPSLIRAQHAIVLPGLQAGKTYHVKAISTVQEASGASEVHTSSDVQFTTPGP